MRTRLARLLQLLVPALAVGLLIGGAGWQLQRERNAAEAQARLEDLGGRVERRLRDRLRGYEHGLRGLRGLAQGLGLQRFDRQQFERYMGSRDLPREFPGMRGTGLIRRVSPEQERDFVVAAQADGQPSFRIRQLREHEGERFVIRYIAPLADNRAALGLDIASEPLRRAAALSAARSGEARLTAPIRIVQAPGQAGALLLLPLFDEGRVPAGDAQREAECLGWAYAPLVIPEVLHSLDLGDPRLRVRLFDAAQREPVFASGAEFEQSMAEHARDLAVFGRQWQLRLDAPADYPQALGLPEPRDVGMASGLLAALAALLLMQSRESRSRNQALLAERSRRAALVDASSDAHLLLDAEGKVLDWNPGAERLFGHAADAVRGRPAADLLGDGAGLAGLLAQLAREGRLAAQDRVGRHADGSPLDLSLVGSALRAADGSLVGYALTLRDIGAAKALERRMQQLNEGLEQQVAERTELLDRVGELASVGGWQYDFDSRRISWTTETYRLHGVARDYQPVLGEALDFYAPEARVRISGAVERAARDGTPWDLELPFLPRDGRRLWVRTVGVPMRRGGRIVGMQGALQDITARRNAERERQRNAELLRLVLASASEVAIIATDPRLLIQVFNRGAERLLGYRAEELVGLHTPGKIHDSAELEAREQELARQLGRPPAFGEVFTLDDRLGTVQRWTYRRKDGSRVPVLLTVTAMSGDDGELLGYLGIAQDATWQQQREQALQQARDKAEQASAAKSQFLANMSHEIRTPMNAVLGLAYLLAQTPLDAEQARFVARIRSASQGLLALLNDILDLSKIEAGELILEQRGFDPRALLVQLQELFSAQAQAKGLALSLELPPTLPAALRGDATRLRQVLTNLIANAIKFTASGGVQLRLQAEAQDESAWRLLFEVEDSGIGIAPEAQQTIFRPFAQADESTTRRYGGTGLGLSIARELVDAMGGRLALRSSPGLGSCFSFELLLDADDSAPPAEPPAQGLRLDGVRVLVADDSEINVEVASRLLAQQGAEVCSAANGAEALALLRSRELDIVLMDLQMPVLDGVAATRELREAGYRLPVVALTAGALASERQRALDAGMDAFLGKPFQPQELIALIRRLVPEREAALAPITAAAATDWPELPGITRDDAMARLGGDFPLFARLLRQLLRDAPAGDALQDAAALHKLRGGAGNLGALRLHRLATEAEAAARAGDLATLSGLQPALQAALGELQAAVARLPAPVPQPEAGGGDLQQLREELRGNNLAALAHAEAMAAQLQAQLGEAGLAQFQQLLAGLRFAEAERLLG